MAVTITPYNHTAARLAAGVSPATNTFKVNLYSALPFIAGATTKTAAEVGATQLATANGYTQNSRALAGITVTTVTTNGAKFDANDVQWTAATGNIAGEFGLLYDDTAADDPPMFHINFGEIITAVPGNTFDIIWNANGIYTFAVV